MNKLSRRQFITGGAAVAAAAALAGCSPSGGEAQESAPAGKTVDIEGAIPGIYEGTADGLGGAVGTLVTVGEGGRIESITIEQNYETAGFAAPAMQRVVNEIMAGQTLNVDTVAGATFSSAAVRGAVKNALEQAGVADYYGEAEKYSTPILAIEDQQADVVVVGAGVAGLMCSIIAARDGLDVVLLEKMPYLGGSMLRCDSTWLCAGGMKDGLRLGGEAWVPYYDYSTPVSNREFIRIGDCMNDLLDMGVSFVPYEDDPFAPIYMDSSRLSSPRWREGNAQVAARMTAAAYEAGVRIYTEAAVTGLIDEGGAVVGVTAEQPDGHAFEVRAGSVVLASGNYTMNEEIMKEHMPDFVGVRNSFCSGDTGDHMAWVERLGGTFHSLDVAPSTLSMERSERNVPFFTCFYSIVVDRKGRRFVSEGDGTYVDYGFVPKNAVWKYPDDPTHFFIMDQAFWDMFPARPEISDLLRLGYATKHDTLEDVMETYGLDELADEVKHYNEMVAKGEDADFGRLLNFQEFSEEGPYWVVETTPGMIMNYGGVVVNRDFAVTTESGEPIPGLYAIGQTVGATPLMEGLEGALDGGIGPFSASGWVLGHQLAGKYVGGTYTAAAQTDEGELQVRVTVDDDTRKVSAVEFPVSNESGDGEALLKDLAAKVLDTQAMPEAAEPSDVFDAFVEAFSVCLQKADTFFEFSGGADA